MQVTLNAVWHTEQPGWLELYVFGESIASIEVITVISGPKVYRYRAELYANLSEAKAALIKAIEKQRAY